MPMKAVEDSIDDVPEQYRDLYTERNGKYELTGIEGVKTEADVARVQTSLQKERAEHKATKEQVAAIQPLLATGLSIADIGERVSKYDELVIAAEGKIDEKKLEGIVTARVNARIAPIERERDQAKAELGEAQKEIGQFKQEKRSNTIAGAVRQAATKAGVAPTAIDDIVLIAERVMDIDDSGNILTRDNVGATPFVDPTTWLSDMKASRPHWWPVSVGGGSQGGGRGAGGGGTNPFSAEGWNMTAQGQMFQADPKMAENMAKAAGTTIGGTKPQPRKV